MSGRVSTLMREKSNHSGRESPMMLKLAEAPHFDVATENPGVTSLYPAANANKRRRARVWFENMVALAKKERRLIFVEEKLTPELAEYLLTERNPNNRRVSETSMNRYETDLKNGDWQRNGETLKISKDGLLNDGQHRCETVVRTRIPMTVTWVFGLTRESRYSVDQGKTKLAADYLSMDNVAYSSNVAVISGLLWQYDKLGWVNTRGGNGKGTISRPTKAQVRETYGMHPKLKASIQAVPTNGCRAVGGHSALAFCHYLFSKIDPSDAALFIQKLIDGDDLGKTSWIYHCRERLLKAKAGRLHTGEKVELIFRAWNAWRKKSTDKAPLAIVGGALPVLE